MKRLFLYAQEIIMHFSFFAIKKQLRNIHVNCMYVVATLTSADTLPSPHMPPPTPHIPIAIFNAPPMLLHTPEHIKSEH